MIIVAQENDIKLNEKSKEHLPRVENNKASPVKDGYEQVKEFVDFNNVVETLTDKNLFKLITCGALSSLFMPLIMHYYPQFPYIKQNLEMIKLLKLKEQEK